MSGPTNRPPWSVLQPYARPFRLRLAACLALFLFVAATELLKPWPLKFIIDDVLAQHDRLPGFFLDADHRLRLLFASLSVVVMAAIGGLAEYRAQLLVARIGHTIAGALRRDVFTHIQQLSVTFHRSTGSGEMLTRILKDVQDIKHVLGEVLIETVTQLVLLGGMAFVLLAMDRRLALIALCVFGPIAWLVHYYAGHMRDLTRRQRQKEGRAASIMTEAIAMLPAVQLFGRGAHAAMQFGRAERKNLEAEVAGARMKGRLERWVEVIVATGTGAVLWFGAQEVMGGRLSAGDLVVFSAYLRSMYRPMRRVATNWLQISRAGVSAERIAQLLQTVPEIVDLPHARPAPRFAGDIEFNGVTFGYRGGPPTLRDITLRIPAGSMTALVGRSGAGKSTLVSLLPRLIDPTAGTVRIDGSDVRDYTLASLREQVCILTQETMLFGLSVRDNVAYGDSAPDEGRVMAALDAAGARQIVDRLPHGLDTRLSERGTSLSGGERQRLAIARAFYRDARILILDEPANGLDGFAEAQLMRSLGVLVRGRTTLLITHRLSTIGHADLVLYLEDGQVVESGPPHVLRTAGGPYQQLLGSQSASLGVR